MKAALKIRAKKNLRPHGVSIKVGEIHWVREDLAEKYIKQGKADLVSPRVIHIPDDVDVVDAPDPLA